MVEGDLTLSSPPYEKTEVAVRLESGGGQETRQAKRESGEWEGYNKVNPDNLGSSDGETFWIAARKIVEEVYLSLKPGGHAIWIVKAYVKNKEYVDFPDQWRRLCEAVGFTTLHVHRAMVVEERGDQYALSGELPKTVVERKSFFRRLAERKGSPRIDWEEVICMEKGL
jgi:hypothetical protein